MLCLTSLSDVASPIQELQGTMSVSAREQNEVISPHTRLLSSKHARLNYLWAQRMRGICSWGVSLWGFCWKEICWAGIVNTLRLWMNTHKIWLHRPLWALGVRNNLLEGINVLNPRFVLHCFKYPWMWRTLDMWSNLAKSRHVPYTESVHILNETTSDSGYWF